MNVKADILVQDVDPEDVELFLIPGGEPKEMIRNPYMRESVDNLNRLLMQLNNLNCKIAAICGGPTFLANSGILRDKNCTGSIADDERDFFKDTQYQDQDMVMNNNILTAQGHVFSKFAVEIAKWLGVVTVEEEVESTLKWLQNT